MFDLSEVENAVEIQRRAYELLLWVGRAIERGFIPVDRAHEYSSERASAAAWLQRHYLDLPKSCRPSARSGPELERYANYFASYLATSFDLDPRPGYRLTSRCGCYCTFCSRLAAAQYLKPRKITSRDKKRAQEIKHAYVAGLAREAGSDPAPAKVAHVLDDEDRSRAAALAAYGKELLSRCRGGGSSGTAVLVLWRQFAWTPQGSPNPKFRLRSKDIIEAERMLIAALAA